MRRLLLLLLLPLALKPLFAAFKPWYNYYNPTYGVKAMGMGNAFTAVADDGTAAYWNPAGIGRFSEPQFYLSYRSDLQAMSEFETRTQDLAAAYYASQLHSRVNQIDFFSIVVPFKGKGWSGGGALSYYRYFPTGFKGYFEMDNYRLNPFYFQRLYRLDFQGSEGADILAFSAAASIRKIVSFGVTLQVFFNTANIQYQQSGEGQTVSQKESKLLDGRNLIFGLLVTPLRFLTFGLSYQTAMHSTMNATSVSMDETPPGGTPGEPLRQVIDVRLPTRVAVGMKIEPFPFLQLAYEYSKVFWEKGSLQGFESFNKNLFFIFQDEATYEKRNPRNQRLGAQVKFKYRGTDVFLRGGWFSEREFYTDVHSNDVYVRGFSLGLALRLSPDLLLEAAFQRPQARWREKSLLYKDADLFSDFVGTIFSFSINYQFKNIFSKS